MNKKTTPNTDGNATGLDVMQTVESYMRRRDAFLQTLIHPSDRNGYRAIRDAEIALHEIISEFAQKTIEADLWRRAEEAQRGPVDRLRLKIRRWQQRRELRSSPWLKQNMPETGERSHHG